MTAIAPSVLDALLHPDDTAAGLAQWTPQAVLVEPLDELTPAMLSVDGQIDTLVAVERHIAMLQARSTEMLAALDAGDTTRDGFTRDHVAAALRVPPASMRTQMTVASELVDRLPDTLALLRAGEITQRHAMDLADATRSLTQESATAVEARVLARAPEQTVAQFRASVRRAVLHVTSPAEEQQAHEQAVTERRVVLVPADRGMAWVNCYLAADGAASLLAAVDAIAHETLHGAGGDTRSADQRRADALTEIAMSVLADPHLTRGHGQRPAIGVTIAASTLMGLDDQPAELDGYGPITAAMARRIAADPTATWRRLLTDDHGHVHHASTKTYRPTAAITATVLARDVHCAYPGCRRKACYTDLDHTTAWRPGHLTTPGGMSALCRRHHRLRHTGRWRIQRDHATGVTTWTDRRGRQYRSRPPSKPTTTTGPITAAPSPDAAPPEAVDTTHHDPRQVPRAADDQEGDAPPF